MNRKPKTMDVDSNGGKKSGSKPKSVSKRSSTAEKQKKNVSGRYHKHLPAVMPKSPTRNACDRKLGVFVAPELSFQPRSSTGLQNFVEYPIKSSNREVDELVERARNVMKDQELDRARAAAASRAAEEAKLCDPKKGIKRLSSSMKDVQMSTPKRIHVTGDAVPKEGTQPQKVTKGPVSKLVIRVKDFIPSSTNQNIPTITGLRMVDLPSDIKASIAIAPKKIKTVKILKKISPKSAARTQPTEHIKENIPKFTTVKTLVPISQLGRVTGIKKEYLTPVPVKRVGKPRPPNIIGKINVREVLQRTLSGSTDLAAISNVRGTVKTLSAAKGVSTAHVHDPFLSRTRPRLEILSSPIPTPSQLGVIPSVRGEVQPPSIAQAFEQTRKELIPIITGEPKASLKPATSGSSHFEASTPISSVGGKFETSKNSDLAESSQLTTSTPKDSDESRLMNVPKPLTSKSTNGAESSQLKTSTPKDCNGGNLKSESKCSDTISLSTAECFHKAKQMLNKPSAAEAKFGGSPKPGGFIKIRKDLLKPLPPETSQSTVTSVPMGTFVTVKEDLIKPSTSSDVDTSIKKPGNLSGGSERVFRPTSLSPFDANKSDDHDNIDSDNSFGLIIAEPDSEGSLLLESSDESIKLSEARDYCIPEDFETSVDNPWGFTTNNETQIKSNSGDFPLHSDTIEVLDPSDSLNFLNKSDELLKPLHIDDYVICESPDQWTYRNPVIDMDHLFIPEGEQKKTREPTNYDTNPFIFVDERESEHELATTPKPQKRHQKKPRTKPHTKRQDKPQSKPEKKPEEKPQSKPQENPQTKVTVEDLRKCLYPILNELNKNNPEGFDNVQASTSNEPLLYDNSLSFPPLKPCSGPVTVLLQNPGMILEMCWVRNCNNVGYFQGCGQCYLTYCYKHALKKDHGCADEGIGVISKIKRSGAEHAARKVKSLGRDIDVNKSIPDCECMGLCRECKFYFHYVNYFSGSNAITRAQESFMNLQ